MLIKMLKGKIHRATVTKTKIDYPGSIAIDTKLLEAAGILPYEAVLLADVTNGARLETYVVPAEHGSGKIEILGAAAHLIKQGDIIIIINFGQYTPEEAKLNTKPPVATPDANNQI